MPTLFKFHGGETGVEDLRNAFRNFQTGMKRKRCIDQCKTDASARAGI